jgi:hypothetical protein
MARIGLRQRDGSAEAEHGRLRHGALEGRRVRHPTGLVPVLVRDPAGETAWCIPTAALLAPS